MKIERAYGVLETKALDDDTRELTGIASTIATDRMGDVIVPEGAKFKLPMPLLAHHDPSKPIGEVIEADVTGKSIRIKARIAKDSGLQYVEDAWKQVRAKLVRGLSIGFRSLKFEPIDAERPWNGFKFLEWEWLELSAVTIPANAGATIQTVKSFAAIAPTASGHSRGGIVLQSGVSDTPKVAKGGGITLIRSNDQ